MNQNQEHLDLIRASIKHHVDAEHDFSIAQSATNVLLRLHTQDGTRESSLYSGSGIAEMCAFACDQHDIYRAEKQARDFPTVELVLPKEHMMALAQLVKRIPFSDVRNSAVDDRECYLMMDALELLRKVLADVGYAPR